MPYRVKDGITLIELMMVVAIIATLATLSMPNLFRVRLTSEKACIRHELQVVNVAIVQYFFEHSRFPTDISQLRPYLPGITDLEDKYTLNPVFGER